MWSESNKERFYYEVKSAMQSGATPEELEHELEQAIYLALDEMKRSAQRHFGRG